MAFIEPRLIHLLNDSVTPQLTHTDLPSFSEAFPDSADRPLPLEPTAGHHEEQVPHGALAIAYVGSMQSSVAVEDGPFVREARIKDGEFTQDRVHSSNASRIPLRLLLGESDIANVSFTTSMNTSEHFETWEDAGSKKRNRAHPGKDDLLHLPQPVKKQKPATQPLLPSMPPIINGLHEPPPNAALFPPISSTEFDATGGGQHAILRDYPTVTDERPVDAPQSSMETPGEGRTRKKSMKPRRKWSEAETNHLLLGVNRHGVGKWTDILADSDFEFNNRTAGDLKDRFRTCCPNELRKSRKEGKANKETVVDPLPTPPAEPGAKTLGMGLSATVLGEPDESYTDDLTQALAFGADTASGAKRSRAHRRKLEDLVELGIHGPFKKSRRRERRPFSELDDKQILEGLSKYGPAWTKIQRDPDFSLSGRQPTDLRDRVRNKYPDVYQQIDKGIFQTNETKTNDTKTNDTMEPSVSTSIGTTLQSAMPSTIDSSLPRICSREDLPRWPPASQEASELPANSHPFDMSEPAAVAFMGSAGEMDISRLLLDDSQVSGLPVKQFASDFMPEA